MFILKIKELDVIRIQFTSVFFSLQVKLRLQTHYQNVESLLSIYEDVIVEVGMLSPVELKTLITWTKAESLNISIPF
jgi:hypothetical protein